MKILLLLFMLFTTFGTSAQTSRPNIIFILTDDQSYQTMGCTGDPLTKTPNLDALANEGTLFTKYYITSAICTPSRVSMLLGEYERKHGVNFNSATSVAPEAWEQSYPMVLRRHGYYTGYIGKNHAPIGHGGYESGIMEKSFDYWYAGHNHIGFYPKDRHKIFKGAEANTQPEILREGANDFLSNNGYKLEGALHFLDQRPANKPFSLTICFNLPHDAGTSTMKQLPEDSVIYRTLYRDLEIPLPVHYIAKKDIKTPKLPPEVLHVEDRQAGYNWVDNPKDCRERLTRQMQAMTGIDGMVGKLREQLKKQGLERNTIIIFTSDHGQFVGQFGLGGKALCYEQVTHVPLIIYNPLVHVQKKAVKKNDALVQSIDLAPTMLRWAGIEPPASYQGYDIGGTLLHNDLEVRDYVFTENLWSTHFGNPVIEAVQDKRWKYIRYYANNNLSARQKMEVAKLMGIAANEMMYSLYAHDAAVYRNYIDAPFHGEKPVYEELYDLEKDPYETKNLATDADQRGRIESMRVVCTKMVTEARGTQPPRVVLNTQKTIESFKSKE